jgi:hypothetical protein
MIAPGSTSIGAAPSEFGSTPSTRRDEGTSARSPFQNGIFACSQRVAGSRLRASHWYGTVAAVWAPTPRRPRRRGAAKQLSRAGQSDTAGSSRDTLSAQFIKQQGWRTRLIARYHTCAENNPSPS